MTTMSSSPIIGLGPEAIVIVLKALAALRCSAHDRIFPAGSSLAAAAAAVRSSNAWVTRELWASAKPTSAERISSGVIVPATALQSLRCFPDADLFAQPDTA